MESIEQNTPHSLAFASYLFGCLQIHKSTGLDKDGNKFKLLVDGQQKEFTVKVFQGSDSNNKYCEASSQATPQSSNYYQILTQDQAVHAELTSLVNQSKSRVKWVINTLSGQPSTKTDEPVVFNNDRSNIVEQDETDSGTNVLKEIAGIFFNNRDITNSPSLKALHPNLYKQITSVQF